MVSKATCAESAVANFETILNSADSAFVKALGVTMSLNGMGFRAIERVTGINHNSVLNWVRFLGSSSP